MAYGIQLRDGSNNVIFDYSDSSPRILGQVEANAPNAGSIYNGTLTTGNLFYMLVPLAQNPSNDSRAASDYAPQISLSNGTLSWSYPSGIGLSALIIYGVY
jgi:hypothetical protein